MRSDAVDAWLGHWLKIQKKNKRPLVLINPSDRASDKQANPTTMSKEKQRKGKGRYVDGDDSSNEDITDDDIVDGEDGRSNADAPGTRPHRTKKSSGGMANGEVVPQSPTVYPTRTRTAVPFLPHCPTIGNTRSCYCFSTRPR
jgi:hypothetical protein